MSPRDRGDPPAGAYSLPGVLQFPVEQEPTDKKSPIAETDPRFPSGEWKGFYLQRGIRDRQWMTLVMQFAEGKMTGEGRDSVGEFTLRGSYDLSDGHCLLTKTYRGSHRVIYDG